MGYQIVSGKAAKGRSEIKKFSEGGKLTQQKSIWANCYQCMGGYEDGVQDCKNPDCPLYPYHPYRGKK